MNSSHRATAPDVVTFDCYGTLIDWETGIRNSFLKALAKYELGSGQEGRVFELYEEEERRVEKQPYHSYREVLSESVLAAAEKIGWDLTREQSQFLANDLPNWKPFEDTNNVLRSLAKHCKLGILSNVDNDLLAGTRKHLEVPFQIVVTAEMVRSYKPGRAHFDRARKIIGNEAEWVHVAGSFYHDIEPATKLGIRAMWVNRRGVPAPRKLDRPVDEVRDLESLVTLLAA
jgi:2-haloalkanoic acid dehalogenase type II